MATKKDANPKILTLGQRVQNLEQDVKGKDGVYWGALGRLEARIRDVEHPTPAPLPEPTPPVAGVPDKEAVGCFWPVFVTLLLLIAAIGSYIYWNYRG